VGLSFDGRPHTVLMATPARRRGSGPGLRDHRGIAKAPPTCWRSRSGRGAGHPGRHPLAQPGALAKKARPRNLEGRSSCGSVRRAAPGRRRAAAAGAWALGADRALAIPARPGALEAEQALGRLTRATHAAAFFTRTGRWSRSARTSVATTRWTSWPARWPARASTRRRLRRRHQPLLVRDGREDRADGLPDPGGGLGPDRPGVTKAEEANLTLVALARADGHAVFAGAERLLESVMEYA
jgi:FdhD protein